MKNEQCRAALQKAKLARQLTESNSPFHNGRRSSFPDNPAAL